MWIAGAHYEPLAFPSWCLVLPQGNDSSVRQTQGYEAVPVHPRQATGPRKGGAAAACFRSRTTPPAHTPVPAKQVKVKADPLSITSDRYQKEKALSWTPAERRNQKSYISYFIKEAGDKPVADCSKADVATVKTTLSPRVSFSCSNGSGSSAGFTRPETKPAATYLIISRCFTTQSGAMVPMMGCRR